MKYFGGCDAGSTYTKCVILDETGRIAAHMTTRSRINPVLSAQAALEETVKQVSGLERTEDLAYLVGTGYGRNKVPFADENISEISCHAMGVHVVNPEIRAVIDIGGQDVKGFAVAGSEVISLVGEGKPMEEIAAGIQMSVAKRCFVMAKKAGATDSLALTGGCAKNAGLKDAIEKVLKIKVIDLEIDPQLMGALGAAEYGRQRLLNRV